MESASTSRTSPARLHAYFHADSTASGNPATASSTSQRIAELGMSNSGASSAATCSSSQAIAQ